MMNNYLFKKLTLNHLCFKLEVKELKDSIKIFIVAVVYSQLPIQNLKLLNKKINNKL